MKREALCQVTQTVSAGNLSPCTTKRITNKFFMTRRVLCKRSESEIIRFRLFFCRGNRGKRCKFSPRQTSWLNFASIEAQFRRSENSHWRNYARTRIPTLRGIGVISPAMEALRRAVCKETLCSDRYVRYVKAKSSN